MSEPAEKRQRPKLPRQVKILGFVSLMNDAASEMIVPLMPAFITSVLGLGPQVLGIMEGVADTVTSIVKYLAGWWSDRLKKRKPLVVAGYSLAALVRPLIGLAGAAWHLVALRGADRFGKGLRTAPRDALLSQSADPGGLGRAFGFHRAMDNLGAVIGPVLAMILLSGLALDLRTIFLLTIIPGLLTVALLVLGLKEKSNEPVISTGARPANAGQAERRNLEEIPRLTSFARNDKSGPDEKPDRAFYPFLAAMLIFTLGNSTDMFLMLRAQELGISVALVPALWLVLQGSKSLLNMPGGILSDRIGRKPTILAGWAVYALAYAGFAFATEEWQIWPLLIFYGLYYGLTEGPEKAVTAELVPKSKRGWGFGLYHLGIGIAALPASALAGFLWKDYGPAAAFGFGAACAALAAGVLLFGFHPKKFKV